MRNAAAAAALVLIGITVPLTITKGNRIYGGNYTLVALWAAVATAVLIWALATDVVAKRVRLELGIQRDPEWVERLPYYLNPKNSRAWCANLLIEQGHAILLRIPRREAPSLLVKALMENNPLVEDHRRTVAAWQKDVYTFLGARAPDCQALFRMRDHIPDTNSSLREHMKKRIEELKTIHGRLND